MAQFKKQNPAAPAARKRSDPTKTKSFKRAVASAASKTRAKVTSVWEDKMKKLRDKAKVNKKDLMDVAVHDIAIPSTIGSATSLGLDFIVAKVPQLKKSPGLARAAKVLAGVALTAGAGLSKTTRRYAPALTNGPLTVVLSDIGRQTFQAQLAGVDEDQASAQAAAMIANEQLQALQNINGIGEAIDYAPSEVVTGRVMSATTVVN